MAGKPHIPSMRRRLKGLEQRLRKAKGLPPIYKPRTPKQAPVEVNG